MKSIYSSAKPSHLKRLRQMLSTMRTNQCSGAGLAAVALFSILSTNVQALPLPPSAPTSIGQLGTFVGKQYQGDGLSVAATPSGAQLCCTLQRLEGQVTSKGLWLSSTVAGAASGRFQVKAAVVTRSNELARKLIPCWDGSSFWVNVAQPLPGFGKAIVDGQVARFRRAELTEEYSVSVD